VMNKDAATKMPDAAAKSVAKNSNAAAIVCPSVASPKLSASNRCTKAFNRKDRRGCAKDAKTFGWRSASALG
jgi:hypothetical protein